MDLSRIPMTLELVVSQVANWVQSSGGLAAVPATYPPLTNPTDVNFHELMPQLIV